MIYPITMYACQCDNCGKQWFDDHTDNSMAQIEPEIMLDAVRMGEDWHIDGDKQYCPDCVTHDEATGEYVVNPVTTIPLCKPH